MRLLPTLTAAAVLAGAALTTAGAASAAQPPGAAACLVAAHRGNTNVAQTVATENTMNAFGRATTAGADYLEMDLGTTSDNTIMVMHDLTVDRTTKRLPGAYSGAMRNLTGTQVKTLTTLDGVAGGVPYLSQVVAFAQTHPTVRLLPQLSDPGGDVWWARLVTNLTPIRDRVVMQGDNPAELDRFHQLMPDVPTVLVTFPGTGMPSNATLAPYSGWVGDQSLFTQPNMDGLDQSKSTFPYVVNDPATFPALAGQVSAVVTNKPGAWIAFRMSSPACAA